MGRRPRGKDSVGSVELMIQTCYLLDDRAGRYGNPEKCRKWNLEMRFRRLGKAERETEVERSRGKLECQS